MKDDNAEFYRRSVEDLIVAQNKSKFIDLEIDGSEGVCPIDKEPCGFVSSCDDVLSLALGVDMHEGVSCPRAVKAFKK